MALTATEIEQYREQGYVIPKYRLPDELVHSLRVALDRLLATYTDVAQEDIANPHMLPPTSGPDLNSFMATARQPGVLDMLEQLIGPDLVLWITRVLCKPAGEGQGSALAPGRGILADATARHLLGVDRARPGEHRERLHALHSGLPQAARAVSPPRDAIAPTWCSISSWIRTSSTKPRR